MYSYDFPEQQEGQVILLLQCILFQCLQLEAFELRLDPFITDFDFPDLQQHSQPWSWVEDGVVNEVEQVGKVLVGEGGTLSVTAALNTRAEETILLRYAKAQ